MNKTGVHISTMSGKLEGMHSISTNTLSNPFCSKMSKGNTICGFCYSVRMLKTFRQTMVNPLEHNSKFLSEQIMTKREIPKIMDAFFRFNSHGELINTINLENYCLITEDNPWCNFALWSKRIDIVRKHFRTRPIPKNMILVYSNPTINSIMKVAPPPFHKTFNNVEEHLYKKQQNCTGQKCRDCLKCYNHDGTNTITEKVKGTKNVDS